MSPTVGRQAIPLGFIAGIPIRIDPSWFLIFALVTWTLASGYYPAEFRGWPGWQYWAMGALTALMFFGSVLLHELSHSLVAQRFGTPVRSTRSSSSEASLNSAPARCPRCASS